MSAVELAVIGGSGLYDIPGLQDTREVEFETPFGSPSAAIRIGTLHGRELAFLPRHGTGHSLSPTEVPYAANIYALKSLGARYIISVSACGSLRHEMEPGHIVVPDQLYDQTRGMRQHTFFGNGLVAHVGVANPFSPELNQVLAASAGRAGGMVHNGGSFVTIEGPRFSTRAESNVFRQLGMSIVGMTTSPEAFLAAEAEIAYSCMAHVTDYDVWHESEGPVSVEKVVQTLKANTELARETIRDLVETIEDWRGEFAAHNSLAGSMALVGDWSSIPVKTREDLAPLISRYAS